MAKIWETDIQEIKYSLYSGMGWLNVLWGYLWADWEMLAAGAIIILYCESYELRKCLKELKDGIK